MPKYRVLEKSYINDTLVEAGAIVDYDGKPGKNLEGPVDEDGKLIKAKAKKGAAKSEEAPAEEPEVEPTEEAPAEELA